MLDLPFLPEARREFLEAVDRYESTSAGLGGEFITVFRKSFPLKSTRYFQAVRSRPDRAAIEDGWIIRVVNAPEHEQTQEDGRIRRWARIPEANDRYLRVVVLDDGETVHNAFFDRGFKP